MPTRTGHRRTSAYEPAPFAMAPEGGHERRRGINSVEIGLRVLAGVIDLRGPASLKAIAQKAGMDSSQTHRYVSSLVNCGMLKQLPTSGLYDLGPSALQVGLAAMARQDALAIMETATREFSQQNSITTLLTLWGGNGPTILRWYHGNPPVYTTLTVGSILPVTRSATGKVFMSYLPDVLLNPFLEKEGWRAPLSKNPDLVAERDQIRALRIASVDGLVIPGLRAHAAPAFGIDEMLVGVVSICAAESTRTDDRSLKTKLVSAARRMSLELGAREP